MNTKLFIGTSGWYYSHWKEIFYPANLAKSKWFGCYCNYFNAVEINATFYRSFKEDIYLNWYNKAPENFIYVLKAPRIITHSKYLKNCENDIRTFNNSVKHLKEKLGMILLQIAPKTNYDLSLLKEVILFFDKPDLVSVEFREAKWFTNDVKGLLQKTGAVLCDADSPITGFVKWVTDKKIYLRLHGKGEWYTYDYSKDELYETAKIIIKHVENGINEIYVFFNNDYNAYAVKNALYLKKILGDRGYN